MFYQNRFDTKDILHYIFYLLQAACAFTMACHLTYVHETGSWDRDKNLQAFAVAAAVSRLSHAFMYSQILPMTTKFRVHIIALNTSQATAAVLYLLSGFVAPHLHLEVFFWLGALLVERFLLHMLVMHSGARMIPWHNEHLFHREVYLLHYLFSFTFTHNLQGTFILLLLGDAIFQLVSHSDITRSLAVDYSLDFMLFAIVFNIGDIYYQQQIVGKHQFHEHKQVPSYIWTSLHMILSLSLLYFGVGLTLVKIHSDDDQRELKYEHLMCRMAAASLSLIYLLRMHHKGLFDIGKLQLRRWVYGFRFCVSGACAVVPYATTDSVQTTTIVFALTVLLIGQDLVSHEGYLRQRSEDGSEGRRGQSFLDSFKGLVQQLATPSTAARYRLLSLEEESDILEDTDDVAHHRQHDCYHPPKAFHTPSNTPQGSRSTSPDHDSNARGKSIFSGGISECDSHDVSHTTRAFKETHLSRDTRHTPPAQSHSHSRHLLETSERCAVGSPQPAGLLSFTRHITDTGRRDISDHLPDKLGNWDSTKACG